MIVRSIGLTVALLAVITIAAQGQAQPVPLETAAGWGAVSAPDGYKALRIHGRSKAPVLLLAQIFGDFAAHPAMFPRVVDAVEILSCETNGLKMRYRTKFDPKPGGKTEVESLSALKVSVVSNDRIEFTWSSSEVKSKYVQAAWGRALFVRDGSETLVDYVSAVRPRNAAKGVLVESQKGVLASDAKYVIDRLVELAGQRTARARPFSLCSAVPS